MKMKFLPILLALFLVFTLNLLQTVPTLADGPTSTTSVNGVTDVTGAVNAQGVFTQDVNASSDDNNVVLHILSATTGLTESGAPLTQISITHMATPPAFQTGAGMITPAYDFEPSGATFNQTATVTFSYDPTKIPVGLSATGLQVCYYDNTTSSWIALPATGNTFHTISAQITHFTAFAVTYGVVALTQITNTTTTTTTTTTTISPTIATTLLPVITPTAVTPAVATFKANSLIINPSTVKPGATVNIYLTVTNTSEVSGTDMVVLMVNNQTVDSKNVSVDGGKSTVVTFNTRSNLSGTFFVAVAGLDGNFTVTKSVTPPWLWAVAVIGFVIGVIAAIIFVSVRNNNS